MPDSAPALLAIQRLFTFPDVVSVRRFSGTLFVGNQGQEKFLQSLTLGNGEAV